MLSFELFLFLNFDKKSPDADNQEQNKNKGDNKFLLFFSFFCRDRFAGAFNWPNFYFASIAIAYLLL